MAIKAMGEEGGPQAHDVKRKSLDALTSLRFFAALMVFVWHVRVLVGVPLVGALELGYTGVGFFYILSGFILTYVYGAKLATGDRTAIKKFYISRIAKLWPVHIATFLISLPLVLMAAQSIFPVSTKLHLLVAALLNLTLLQSWIPNNTYNFSYNGVAWSISVELFFYALFPLLIFYINKLRHVLTVKRIITIMICLWLLMSIIMLPFASYVDDWRLYVFPPARLPDFISGILLGMLFLRLPKERASIRRVVSRLGSTSYEITVLSVFVLGVILSVTMPQSLRFAVWMLPASAAVIFVFAQQGGVLSRALSYRPLVFLGEASFSFYMVHQLVIRYLMISPSSDFAVIVLSLVFSLAISGLSYVYYEEPLRLRVKDILDRRIINEYPSVTQSLRLRLLEALRK